MTISIFTDGSSRGNPGPGGWGAIIRTDDQVIELGGRTDNTTNNKMELAAAVGALSYVRDNTIKGDIVLQSDSKYVIKGITEWVSGWKRNDWITAGKKPVENQDFWQALDTARTGLTITWKYVEGHAGHPGNERCDEIATGFADNVNPVLYKGSRTAYTIDLDAAPSKTAIKKKKSSSAPAYSYLSLVDGVLEIHKTWAECEARVKGVKGAKFKKSLNKEDEQDIIKEWGL